MDNLFSTSLTELQELQEQLKKGVACIIAILALACLVCLAHLCGLTYFCINKCLLLKVQKQGVGGEEQKEDGANVANYDARKNYNAMLKQMDGAWMNPERMGPEHGGGEEDVENHGYNATMLKRDGERDGETISYNRDTFNRDTSFSSFYPVYGNYDHEQRVDADVEYEQPMSMFDDDNVYQQPIPMYQQPRIQPRIV